jgi:hypothetical protein
MISAKKSTRHSYTLLLALILFVTACKKSTSGNGGTPPPPTPPGTGEIGATPPGTPVGTPIQKTIGPNGGTLTTADNRISIEFPAGALAAATVVSIQPITNNCPGASGHAFRLLPHGVNFSKPVKLTMTYSDSDFVSTIPAAMTIAYQNEEQRWQAAGAMTKDTTNKKVTVYTDHFSDWALFKAVELVPYSTMVEPGQQVELGIIKLAEFKNDSLIPVPDPLKKGASIVKEWTLSGAGTLARAGYDPDQAIYTAPNTIPAKNPVAVSAVLKISSQWQFTLVSNIYIGNEGLTFRIDKGPWMYCSDPDGVFFDGYTYSISASNLSTPGHDGVTIWWMGSSNIHKFQRWALAWPSFTYAPDQFTIYKQVLVPNATPSPGGIYLHKASENLGYAQGTFWLGPAQKSVIPQNGIPQYSQHTIEGFFKVKW